MLASSLTFLLFHFMHERQSSRLQIPSSADKNVADCDANEPSHEKPDADLLTAGNMFTHADHKRDCLFFVVENVDQGTKVDVIGFLCRNQCVQDTFDADRKDDGTERIEHDSCNTEPCGHARLLFFYGDGGGSGI